MSDLVMLQRVAERAVPPASRAEGPEKWQKWQFLRRIFEHPYTGVNGVGKRDINIRDSSSAILPSSLTSAPSKSGPMTPEHVAAPAVHRFLLFAQCNYTR